MNYRYRYGIQVTVLGFLLSSTTFVFADHAATSYQKGLAYKREGKNKEAIAEFEKAIQARDDYAAAHYSLGVLYRQTNDLTKAAHHLERATKLDGKSAQSFFSLGLTYHAMGRIDDAIVALTEAARRDPKDSHTLSQLGLLLSRKDPEAAIPKLQEAYKLAPTNADIVLYLGSAYLRASARVTGDANEAKRIGLLDQAEKHLKTAAAMQDGAKVRFDLGVLYRRKDEPLKAIEHYEQALHLDPKMAAAYWDLGHMYSKTRQNEKALRAFEKYIELNPNGQDIGIAKKRIDELKAK